MKVLPLFQNKTNWRAKGILILVISLGFIMLLSGCALGSLGQPIEKDKPHVVSSFSVIHDIVTHIGGDRIQADFLTPIGEDPHEFEPTPSTFKLISDADLLFYNGFNMDYWIRNLAQNAESAGREIILTEGVPAIPLSAEAGELSGKEDPHAWLNPKHVMIYAQNVAKALIELDPEGETYYQQNLDRYLTELKELDQWIEEQVKQIPAEKRVVITSESAFKYFAEGYGFDYESIWEINAHEEGSARQIERLVEVITSRQLPAVFLETSVDSRPMDRVASEAGIEIAGEVFTDSIGLPGSGAENYIDMMRTNVKTIVEGLSQ